LNNKEGENDSPLKRVSFKKYFVLKGYDLESSNKFMILSEKLQRLSSTL